MLEFNLGAEKKECQILLAVRALVHNLLAIASCVLGLQACAAVSGPCWPRTCNPASAKLCYHHLWHNTALPNSCVSVKYFSILPGHESSRSFDKRAHFSAPVSDCATISWVLVTSRGGDSLLSTLTSHRKDL